MVRASYIIFEREWGSCLGLFWTRRDTNSYLGPILKGTMANNHDNPNPDVSALIDYISHAEWSAYVKSYFHKSKFHDDGLTNDITV